MNAIRRLAGALAAVPLGIARALRPDPGTTEAAQYFSLLLIAVGFLVRGQPDLALIVPGVWIGLLASAPVLVGILRRGS